MKIILDGTDKEIGHISVETKDINTSFLLLL